MATTLEIVNGISQALANKHDGAREDDGKGEIQKIGLRREKPVTIHDRRMIDGFGANIHGNKLKVFYQSEITFKEVYETKFEKEIESTIDDCVSFLKKEYKRITKSTLGLKKIGEAHIRVEHMNRVRSWVTAHCVYEIEGIQEEKSEHTISDKFKKWLELGGHEGLKK